MIILDALVAILLGWQVAMPAVDNGRYMFLFDPVDQSIVRMDTRDGSMVRCPRETMKCPEETKQEETKKEPITDVVDYR